LRKSSKQLKIASTMHDKKLLYRTSLAPPPLLSNNAPKCELHWPEKLGKNKTHLLKHWSASFSHYHVISKVPLIDDIWEFWSAIWCVIIEDFFCNGKDRTNNHLCESFC
jgi:hypothetical protein